MRKLARLLIVLSLGLAAGCGVELPSAAPTSTPTPAPTSPPSPTPAPEASTTAPPASQTTSGSASCVAAPFDVTVESGIPPISEEDHAHGPADAPITVIEYADFQCPGCAAMATLRMYLEDTYGQDIQAAYRHFPLSFHDKAMVTAEAVEAAAAQGKFWEMHDLLYERAQEWGQLSGDAAMQAQLLEYAEELGLDTERFSRDMTDHTYLDRINADAEVAKQTSLPGTPTYIINGVIYPTQEFGLHPLRISAFIDLLRLKDRMYTAPPPQVIDPDRNYVATIRTEHGDIVIELYAAQAPVNVNSFVFLAQEGWYDGVTFHRVIPGFVAQTGDPTGSGIGSPGYRCDDEIASALTYDSAGVVGMASGGPGTSSIGSQFFITYDALPQLDGNYTIIGRVIEGMDVVESITPRDPDQGAILPPGDVIETVLIEER
jgi:cyclophilin family peptidyl-prolyl cis-trans isomerase/protein-disulfide isomerase